MKKVVFIASHLGSGSDDLIDILNKNPRCVFHNTNSDYSHPDKLEWMYRYGHKLEGHASAVYGDHLLFNMTLSCKALYKICKFVYVIRQPRPTLNEIISSPRLTYNPETAASYYAFRLRRICEMAKRTPGSLLLTWDQLASGLAFPVLDRFLNLKQPLKPEYNHFLPSTVDRVPGPIIRKSEEVFERYFYYLSQLELERVCI